MRDRDYTPQGGGGSAKRVRPKVKPYFWAVEISKKVRAKPDTFLREKR
jgi:hypothetical protein